MNGANDHRFVNFVNSGSPLVALSDGGSGRKASARAAPSATSMATKLAIPRFGERPLRTCQRAGKARYPTRDVPSFRSLVCVPKSVFTWEFQDWSFRAIPLH